MNYLDEEKVTKKRKSNYSKELKKWNKKLRNRKTKKENKKEKFTPNYKEYIKSLTWKKRREKYYETHKRECFICGNTDKVGLHHLHYGNLGQEKDTDLVPLCWEHHGELHRVVGHNKKKALVYLDQERQAIEFYELQKTL